MQRQYQLGVGLLTMEDLERLERLDFTTVGAFATTFEKMARKVPGLAEESQCAIFLSNFTECENISLTRRGAIGRKLTWETVKQSLADGELDQVYQFQMKHQRQKRKAQVVTEGAGINLQQLIADGIAKYQADQQKATGKQVLTVTQPQARAAKKGKVVEQLEDDDDDDEEEEPAKLTKSHRKARNQALGGQGVIPPVWPGYIPYGPWLFYNQTGPPVGGPTAHAAGGYPSAPAQGVNWQGGGQQQQQTPPPQVNQPGQAAGQGQGQNQGGNGQSSQGRGNGDRGRGNGNGGLGGQGGRRGGNWNGQGGNDRPRFDWRNAICHHCALKGQIFRFCLIRKVDEKNDPISTNMDGDVYDMYEKNIDPKIAGGMRKEAQRRAELGPPPPAMFRLWQEEDVRSTIKVDELTNGESEEDIRRQESVVIEEEEEESYCQGRATDTMERMEDLVEKMQRLNLEMRSFCEGVAKPMVYLLGSETGSSSVKPACQTVGSIPAIWHYIPTSSRATHIPASSMHEEGGLKQGSKRRYKRVTEKSHPVPLPKTAKEEFYYKQERELIREMKEDAKHGPCRINERTEGDLIIGESGFLTPQEKALMAKRVQSQSEPAVEDGERGAMGPSSLDGSLLLSESRLAELPIEPEGSLTAQLYDMESPRMQVRQEVSLPSTMDIEIERVEAEVLGLDKGDPTEGIQTQRVGSSPLEFGDTPRRDGDRNEASMRGHRIGALEQENRGLRDTVCGLVTRAEQARQSTSRLKQRVTDLEESRRRQATTDVVGEKRTEEQQIPIRQAYISHEVEPGGVRLDIPRQDSRTEEPLEAIGMACEEAAVVDKLMLEPDEIERRREAEARGLD
ncbi:hypothetical protein CBR_g51376 [Chara braunii]|uniref:Uncharacterized protein n=1 Tax=Chara braunii TaxID=69332 RepID=A0A388M8I9_CHABU|nr:hypothetical protein CBR_g51376 [Chara braunii]|eukprot:GBG90870.1 hypothetical protein CBR_g51376 [Chara braunii]